MGKPAVVGLVLLLLVDAVRASDWPMYRSDAARTGYTAEQLPANLSLRWVRLPRHAPTPAWPRSDRLPFDRAYHVVIKDRTLFFGCSADCRVYALNAATGKRRWSFFTGGPVRFAPVAWKDRVFVAGDDGYLYCLSAKDGKVLWKKRGGPDDSMVLGNDRIISRWPVRGGPVVADGTVYFVAGMWPSEGIFIYALDATTGRARWVNRDSGSIEMDQPHPTARAKSGVSAQGYLVVEGGRLFVPTGRAVPAVFNAADGKLQYFHLQEYGKMGGSFIAASGGFFFNRGNAFNAATGKMEARRFGGPVAALPNMIVRFRRGAIGAFTWGGEKRTDERGATSTARTLKEHWSVANAKGGASLIVAGRTIFSGGKGRVTAVDVGSKKTVWSAEVDGTAFGLAAAGGRLYVSTDTGSIYCFGGVGGGEPRIVATRLRASPYGSNASCARAVREIIKKSGVTEGYCLDLGCGDGALSYELAKRTKLHIYAVDSDPKKVALARRKLESAGFYGTRVTVHEAKPSRTPYPEYFANLVVSRRSLAAGTLAAPRKEVMRTLHPYGGIAVVGKPRRMRKTVRGELKGAGNWTHQYCNAANTNCSTDALVKAPLKMLWFSDLGLVMPSRHGRGPAPLFNAGRLFVEGVDGLLAADAYNGRRLWQYPLKGILVPYDQEHIVGVGWTGSNFCTEGENVYVHTGDRCLVLDAATGKKAREFPAPKKPNGKPGRWGYIACEGGKLFGSLVNEKHIIKWAYHESDMGKLFIESDCLFAMDAATGKVKWTYSARHSIRHNAIAIGAGRVFLIDRPRAEMDLLDFRGDPKKAPPQPTGELLALNAATGRVLWRTAEDIYGTVLALSARHNVLLMAYQRLYFRLPSERGGRMAGFRASDGKRLWDKKMGYASRIIINDRSIYAQPGAWDLLAGTQKAFRFKRSYGCGTVSGGSNILLFRSGTLGYVDLLRNQGTEDYGGIRPGCWINTIAAGGIVLMPDATDRCSCSYLNKASIALVPATRRSR